MQGRPDIRLSFNRVPELYELGTEPARFLGAKFGELVAVIDDEFGGVVTRPLVATMTLPWPNS